MDDALCFEILDKFCQENDKKFPTLKTIENLCKMKKKDAKELVLRYFRNKNVNIEYILLESNKYRCTKCLQMYGGLNSLIKMTKHITKIHKKNAKNQASKQRKSSFNFHDYNINKNTKYIDRKREPPPLSPVLEGNIPILTQKKSQALSPLSPI